MVGAYAVGKTSLVKRYVESIFDEKYQTTIGVTIDKKRLEIDGTALTLVIWDLAGEDDVEQVRLGYMRGASGYILVADGCRQATVDCAVKLNRSIDETIGPVPFVVALNKADLLERWEADSAPLEQLAADKTVFFKTSAKTGEGVEHLFHALGMQMLKAT
jgi:small GTP-binding protein